MVSTSSIVLSTIKFNITSEEFQIVHKPTIACNRVSKSRLDKMNWDKLLDVNSASYGNT